MTQTQNCEVVGCERIVRAKSLCYGHYQRRYFKGDVGEPAFRDKVRSSIKPCTKDNCNKIAITRGYCGTHYQAIRRAGL